VSTLYLAELTREGWLTALAEKLRPRFAEVGFPLPDPDRLRYSTGFPSKSARGKKKRRIGECWDPRCTPDGSIHILISPVLASIEEVGETLVHELGHAAVGVEHGHKGPFLSFCKKIGLEGKPTATVAGEALREDLRELAAQVGEYPHAPLKFEDGEKKQKNRQLKLTCPEHTDYIVRASRKVINGQPPLCGLCSTPMVGDDQDDEEDQDGDET
jgi:hypothetical protein